MFGSLGRAHRIHHGSSESTQLVKSSSSPHAGLAQSASACASSMLQGASPEPLPPQTTFHLSFENRRRGDKSHSMPLDRPVGPRLSTTPVSIRYRGHRPYEVQRFGVPYAPLHNPHTPGDPRIICPRKSVPSASSLEHALKINTHSMNNNVIFVSFIIYPFE